MFEPVYNLRLQNRQAANIGNRGYWRHKIGSVRNRTNEESAEKEKAGSASIEQHADFGCTKSLRNHTHAANHKKRAGAIQPDLSAQEPSGGVSRSSFDTTPRQSANSNTKGPRNLRNADLSLAGAKLEIQTIQRAYATARSIKSGFRFASIDKHRP